MDIVGIEGLSVDEVRSRVDQGGRFVIFTWTVSVLVMTFRRPAAIRFVGPGESAALASMPYTLISLFCGWWGFPWGFIYTPMSIVTNLQGGRDVTAEVMSTLDVGWQRSAEPGSAFRSQPGTMSPAPSLASQAGVDNDAKAALYLGLPAFFCLPLGLASAFFGVRTVRRARDLGVSVPSTAVVGLVFAGLGTLCNGSGLLAMALAPRTPPETGVIARPAPRPTPTREAVNDDEPEPMMAQPGSDDGAHLSFSIAKVYEKHRPSPKPPFHEPGGDWVFFDLQADDGVKLTAGIDPGKDTGDFSFGKVQLSVADTQLGARFVRVFTGKFGGKAAPSPLKAGKGAALEMGCAVLGRGMKRNLRGGGFEGRGGTWVATKLFPEFGERQGEVFFNYALEDGIAELSEKDPEYADDLAWVFTRAFVQGD